MEREQLMDGLTQLAACGARERRTWRRSPSLTTSRDMAGAEVRRLWRKPNNCSAGKFGIMGSAVRVPIAELPIRLI